MRVAILSTDTSHHRYFINRLTQYCDLVGVLFEDFKPEVPLPTQTEIESEVFGALGERLTTGLFTEGHTSLNSKGAISTLSKLNADVGVVFGTGKLMPELFSIPKDGCINVHFGLTQYYRGLDCHLWPIFNREFNHLGVTIHRIDEGLDTGEVQKQCNIQLVPGMVLGQLKAAMTIAAVSLIKTLWTIPLMIPEYGSEASQVYWHKQHGPYYSKMPMDTRNVTARILQQHLHTGGDLS